MLKSILIAIGLGSLLRCGAEFTVNHAMNPDSPVNGALLKVLTSNH